MRPERLYAKHSEATKKRMTGRSPGLEKFKEVLHTVARPRGIHTRFPILPALLTRGTRTLLIEKI